MSLVLGVTCATKPVLLLSRFPNSGLAMKASSHAQRERAAQEVEARSKRGLKDLKGAVRSDDLCSMNSCCAA